MYESASAVEKLRSRTFTKSPCRLTKFSTLHARVTLCFTDVCLHSITSPLAVHHGGDVLRHGRLFDAAAGCFYADDSLRQLNASPFLLPTWIYCRLHSNLIASNMLRRAAGTPHLPLWETSRYPLCEAGFSCAVAFSDSPYGATVCGHQAFDATDHSVTAQKLHCLPNFSLRRLRCTVSSVDTVSQSFC